MAEIKIYDFPKLNKSEIYRYANGENGDYEAILEECLSEIDFSKKMKVAYEILPLKIDGDSLDLGFTKACSKDLARCLNGCEKYVLFALTGGIQFDMLIKKYSIISPVKALFIGAIGTECAEKTADLFIRDLEKEYFLTNRFSAGYGDLSLSLQRGILNTLNAEKLLNIKLNDSLLMTPSKSITAFVGIKGEKNENNGIY